MDGFAGTTEQEREVKLPRVTRVKNRQPADKQVRVGEAGPAAAGGQAAGGRAPGGRALARGSGNAGSADASAQLLGLLGRPQITAEQLLRESKALQQDAFKPPSQKITDPEELAGAGLGGRGAAGTVTTTSVEPARTGLVLDGAGRRRSLAQTLQYPPATQRLPRAQLRSGGQQGGPAGGPQAGQLPADTHVYHRRCLPALAEYRLQKRKEFEDTLRRVGRWNPGWWVKVGARSGSTSPSLLGRALEGSTPVCSAQGRGRYSPGWPPCNFHPNFPSGGRSVG